MKGRVFIFMQNSLVTQVYAEQLGKTSENLYVNYASAHPSTTVNYETVLFLVFLFVKAVVYKVQKVPEINTRCIMGVTTKPSKMHYPYVQHGRLSPFEHIFQFFPNPFFKVLGDIQLNTF